LLAQHMTELTGKKHSVLKPGGLTLFNSLIKLTKVFVPGENEVYPPWQGMQYMRNMYSGECKFKHLDNKRYSMNFSNSKTLLANFLSETAKPSKF
jgi:hypothetical protein